MKMRTNPTTETTALKGHRTTNIKQTPTHQPPHTSPKALSSSIYRRDGDGDDARCDLSFPNGEPESVSCEGVATSGIGKRSSPFDTVDVVVVVVVSAEPLLRILVPAAKAAVPYVFHNWLAISPYLTSRRGRGARSFCLCPCLITAAYTS